MKKIILGFSFCISSLFFSQNFEMGSVGELLNNEEKSSKFYRERQNQNRFSPPRWEEPYTYGYSEVFLRIPERGKFTVKIDNQEITNDTGMFRFFDLSPRGQYISIWYGRYLIYRAKIYPQHNTRLVLDFFTQKGLYLLEEIDLTRLNYNYYGKRWNRLWNDYYHKEEIGYVREMDNSAFHRFREMFEKQSFDDDKLRLFRIQKNNLRLHTIEIGDLMKRLSFAKNKLAFAKEAYEIVLDPGEYYKLSDFFEFKSDAKEFLEFLENVQKNPRTRF